MCEATPQKLGTLYTVPRERAASKDEWKLSPVFSSFSRKRKNKKKRKSAWNTPINSFFTYPYLGECCCDRGDFYTDTLEEPWIE